jgi:hypothetical protein
VVIKNILILSLFFLITSCANHKGAIKPNWGIADFNKYNEGYYLSLDQIKIGDSKDIVLKEFGGNYIKSTNEINNEIWSFNSYKATFATDPIEKIVSVEFSNDIVIDLTEKYLIGLNSIVTTEITSDEKLRKLKKLYDDGVITETEFETKKTEILKNM